ncbi:MAG TPA: nuclear transport factor 2 family protein [Pyrinomonadaceae bacterium]|jgi:ketosteroid isomerase-like protein
MDIRRLLAAALVAAAFAVSAPAQRRVPPVRPPSAQRPPAQQGDEEKLKELVREWADAVVHLDLQKLDRIQADNFGGGAEGRRFSKQQLRAALKSGLMKVAAWTLEDVKVEVRGSSAVVTGKSTLTNAVFMGDDYSGEYEWTDRFVRQKDGSWRAVSSQSKRVKK